MSNLKVIFLISASVFVLLPVTIKGQVNLASSLQLSNRSYVCPGETVTYSCVIIGTILDWDVNNASVCFSEEDRIDTTRKVQDNCYIIRGILVDFFNDTESRVQYCYSTLLVTFGRLNETLHASMNPCPTSQYRMLNIQCLNRAPSVPDNPTRSRGLVHQIAAVPSEDQITGTCAYNSSAIQVNIDVPGESNLSTDLDYYRIDFFGNGAQLDTRYTEITENIISVDVYLDISLCEQTASSSVISINVTAVDECGQKSQPKSIRCIYNSAVPAEEQISGTCSYNSSFVQVDIDVPDQSTTELDYYQIEFNWNTQDLLGEEDTTVSMAVTAVDECGQQMPYQKAVSCTYNTGVALTTSRKFYYQILIVTIMLSLFLNLPQHM